MDLIQDTDPVPIIKPNNGMKNRLEILKKHFNSRFKYNPCFFSRVPGRVNLIGDHIDYSGYSVCPMAIEQDILVAVGKNTSSGFHLVNFDGNYPDYNCDDIFNCGNYLSNDNELHWYKYFICGIVGALEVIPRNKINNNLDIVIWGNIPPASGLSSSSAIVSSAALVITHVFEHEMSRKDLALLSARAERHIGTQGGAMDQAIAFLGKAGAAKLIEFNPLKTTDVILPNDAVFVIANSMFKCNKAATANYNIRVEECRSAAQKIAKTRIDDWQDVKTLGDIQKKLATDLSEILDIAKDVLVEKYPTLFMRCHHVFQEAARVIEFQNICQDKNGDELIRLGEVMNRSHKSLCHLYDCSHEAVDELAEIALKCGAFGIRITGAGWGGCLVALTSKDKVDKFVNDIKNEIKNSNNPLWKDCDLESMIFPTEPQQGAVIFNDIN